MRFCSDPSPLRLPKVQERKPSSQGGIRAEPLTGECPQETSGTWRLLDRKSFRVVWAAFDRVAARMQTTPVSDPDAPHPPTRENEMLILTMMRP